MALAMSRMLRGGGFLAMIALAPAGAQPMLLEIRPTPGDTLHLRLEQMVEMRGTTRVGTRDSTMTMSTSMAILARAIILGADSAGARVLTVTDSVTVEGSVAKDASRDRVRRDLQGSRVEMRVLPDGSSEIVSDPSTLTNELRSLVAQMPATLPRTPVQVGERWSRVVTVPIEAQGGSIATTASLKTTFRFDSLSRNKEIAYVSLRGELSRSAADSAGGKPGVEMTGTIKGAMTIDRKRGWMTDSRAVITLNSVLPAARGSKAYPMRFLLTITQRMHALDKR